MLNLACAGSLQGMPVYVLVKAKRIKDGAVVNPKAAARLCRLAGGDRPTAVVFALGKAKLLGKLFPSICSMSIAGLSAQC